MRVNRRFLYWGIVLVAVGSVLVAADLQAVDTATLTDALRLWPIAIVAIGLSLVLRRTRLSLPAMLVGAAVPGLVVGGALAVGPRFVGDCGARGETVNIPTSQGVFDGPARVSLRSGCGSLNLKTVPGNGWQLVAGNTAGRAPTIGSSARSLSIDAKRDGGGIFLDTGRETWDLMLPTSAIDDLSAVVTTGHGQVTLAGAQISRLSLTANAAEIVADASEAASLTNLAAVVNVGSLSIRLPAGSDILGSLRVGAGQMTVCTPPGLGVRLTSRGMAETVRVNGLEQHASEWLSPDYASAPHRADLSVSVNFGAVEINPTGGCR